MRKKKDDLETEFTAPIGKGDSKERAARKEEF